MHRNEPRVSRAVDIFGLEAELYLTNNINAQMQKYQKIHNYRHDSKLALYTPHDQNHIDTFNDFQPRQVP